MKLVSWYSFKKCFCRSYCFHLCSLFVYFFVSSVSFEPLVQFSPTVRIHPHGPPMEAVVGLSCSSEVRVTSE